MKEKNTEQGKTPETVEGKTGRASAAPPIGAKAETVAVKLRHKTNYPFYRRAGLALAQKAKSFKVTAAQLAELEADAWVVVEQ
jgi:hypothetical protein